ncbi:MULTISPECIES: glycosyltransferase family 4 protein [unclassified Sulfitobacter]|uniref:glycosyltransferase family 4 protein n=1 Tax=unclassified Sulfitobacter TaxID=196795 RepID=UPI0037472581
MAHNGLCIINNIPTPYRRALFDQLAEMAAVNDIEFSVLYIANSETTRAWKVKVRSFERVLPVIWQKRNPSTATSDVVVNYRFLSKGFRPRLVILFGYNYPTYLAVAVLRAVARRPTGLFCETTLSDKPTAAWKMALKSLIFKYLFDRFLVPGQRSAEYLQAHGVKSDYIFTARNASPLQPQALPAPSQGPGLRILFVGRLAPEKRITDFARVFCGVETEDRLTIVGSGPEAETIAEIANGVSNINVLGAREPHELSQIYARHDVLVLVSESEPWGMVVNEAVNHGLALLLSPHVGCVPDLLEGNGVCINDLSVKSLSKALDFIRENLDDFRTRSILIAETASVEGQAASFLKFAAYFDEMKG